MKKSINKIYSLISIALILGLLFWLIDTFINVYYYNSSYSFDIIFDQFINNLQLAPDVYSRIVAIMLLLILGFIAVMSRKQLKESYLQLETKNQIIEEVKNELEKLVFKDSLTDLINRKPFIELLNKNINIADHNEQKLALLFMDLENFKNINDLYGHNAGDEILVEVAKRITKNTREGDIVGRIGGDEFVICLNDVKTTSEIIYFAKRLNKVFLNKMKINNQSINVTVSIGISIYPDDADNAIDLLKNSDIAMFKAKNNKKNTFQFYNKVHTDELMMEQALISALDNNEFSLHYQPIVNREGKCVFIESLCRWTNPDIGSVSPAIFIPKLERSRDIIKVGKWIFNESCKQLVVINNDDDFQNIGISINLSKIQMEENTFLDDFTEIIDNSTVDNSNIVLEITEAEQTQNIDKFVEVLNEIKNGKVGLLALDDFGAGYSSFSNLIRLPVDIIKIDKFLVDQLDSEKYSKSTLDLIALIKGLNLIVLAEGIETKEQYDILVAAGCDFFQGFYFSKPVPNIYDVLKANNGNFLNK